MYETINESRETVLIEPLKIELNVDNLKVEQSFDDNDDDHWNFQSDAEESTHSISNIWPKISNEFSQFSFICFLLQIYRLLMQHRKTTQNQSIKMKTAQREQ